MADLPISIPTLDTIVSRVRGDIAADTGEQDVYLRGTFAHGAAPALGGMAAEVYAFAATVLGELMPDSAKSWGITRWGRSLGVQRIEPIACQASVQVTFTGSATVALGATLTRSSDGAEYTLDAAVTRGSAGTATGAVTASEAGAAGTLEVGDVLTLSTPVANVSSAVTVTALTTDGADIEPLADWKTRILARLASPPQGGSEDDYIAWSKAYNSTIDRVWVFAQTPYLGAVSIYFTIDGSGSGIIPGSTLVNNLQAYLRTLAPVHSAELVYCYAPTGRSIELTIAPSPSNDAIKGEIEESLDAFFATWPTEPGGTLLLDDIRNAIRLGCKSYSSTATFTLSSLEGATPADIDLADGVVPYLGTITWA